MRGRGVEFIGEEWKDADSIPKRIAADLEIGYGQLDLTREERECQGIPRGYSDDPTFRQTTRRDSTLYAKRTCMIARWNSRRVRNR
jgi:hypothetical protein